MKLFKLIFLIALGLISLDQVVPAIAAGTIEISPVKFEINLEAGERQERAVTIANYLGHPIIVKVVVKDFVGSDNVAESAWLVEASTSPYSLRDNISIKAADRQ